MNTHSELNNKIMYANNLTMIGRVGKTPETRTVGQHTVVSFPIALSKSFKVGDEWKEETTWVNVTAWNKAGEAATRNAEKGNLVYVEGELKIREHEGKYYTECNARTIRRLNKKDGNDTSPQPQRQNENDYSGDGLPF